MWPWCSSWWRPCGLAVSVFALAAVTSRPTPDAVAAYYVENALPEVGVKDIVGGIITDFRGTDTLLEILVFSLAALGVLVMLARPLSGKERPGRRSEIRSSGLLDVDADEATKGEYAGGDDGTFFSPPLRDSVTQLAANFTLPLSLLIAAAHIFYAGVNPGDGFTAGVIAGLGVALWFVVFGYEKTKERLPWLHPAPMLGLGLVLALGNALAPLLFGREFFAFTNFSQFSVAEIKIASSLIYEIGIFLAVAGGIGAIMEAISHPREVETL